GRGPRGRAGGAALRLRRGGAGRRRRPRGSLAGRRALVPLHRVPRVGRPHADPQPPPGEGPARVSLSSLTLTESVKARALELGFDLVAVGPAGPPEHGAALRGWVEAGHAGTMGYLERRLEERLHPGRGPPGARGAGFEGPNHHPAERDE